MYQQSIGMINTIKLTQNIFFQWILIPFVVVSVFCPLAFAGEVNGVVTGKKETEVQVTVSKGQRPSIGDAVKFQLLLDDLKIEAGTGTVISVDKNTVWVKVTEGNPDIDMQANIETKTEIKTASSQRKALSNKTTKEPIYHRSKHWVNNKVPVSTQCSLIGLGDSGIMFAPPENKKQLKEITRDANKQIAKINKGIMPKFVYDIQQLAVWTFAGIGVPKNYQKAANLFLYAAKGNHPTAQFNIGLLYQEGQGVSKNIAQAHFWYEKAIQPHENNFRSPYALHNLGCMYLEGNGVPQNKAKAISLFKQAAGGKNPFRGGFGRSIDMLSLLGQI